MRHDFPALTGFYKLLFLYIEVWLGLILVHLAWYLIPMHTARFNDAPRNSDLVLSRPCLVSLPAYPRCNFEVAPG